MDIKIVQISSMEKVRANDDLNYREVNRKSVLAGERVSYQICTSSASALFASVSVESDIAKCVQLYQVREIYMDAPVTKDVPVEDYITKEPGFMPDLLVPMNDLLMEDINKQSSASEMDVTDKKHYQVTFSKKVNSIWVRVDVPKDIKPGVYSIKVGITMMQHGGEIIGVIYKNMMLDVIPALMPEQKLIYTRWFYADCVAVAHNVKIFSEEHWELIEKYIARAADMGVNMILVPIHTPPLDTEIGTTRPCVQLVDIEKDGEHYKFSFSKFKRFIGICKRNGIKYFEMAHMFSQWGAKYAANILVSENGRKQYLFGWNVASDSEEYIYFLKQYIQAIAEELEKEGISEQTYFHISDEPSSFSVDAYKKAHEIIRPLIGKSKTFDALSDYVFFEKGLVECPITFVEHIHEFLGHDISEQWVYYCSTPQQVFTNSFIAMPSYRTRILGYLLYKYKIKGFLHWGFNFYFSEQSLYSINPYLTTSGDRAFPSGDPFIVYPEKDKVYPSIRGEITYEAIQDMNICFALEAHIGRDKVVSMIDATAGYDLRFDHYPRNKEFLENLRAQMVREIKKNVEERENSYGK